MFNDGLTQLKEWLSGSWLNLAIAGHGWVMPALQTVHILAVAVVLAGTLFINLRVPGLAERGQPLAAVLDRFLWPVTVAVAVLALTGVLQIVGEPDRAMFRSLFWVKMAATVVALALTWSQRLALAAPYDTPALLPLRRSVAGLTVLLWLGVIVAGRWIAYSDPWPGAS